MLKPVADGVLVHESAFLQSNCVVVQGATGVLLIDPGITNGELTELAADLRELGQPVVAGFATHPHWDHVLWHASLGDVPRYGTARCAASIGAVLAHDSWRDRVAGVLPADRADDIPLQLFGMITGLPAGVAEVPWNGPTVRIIEHQAHANGHAALLIEGSGVLVAGDMLSDSLIPFLDLGAADPAADYLAALRLFDGVAGAVEVVIPGHGSVGRGSDGHGSDGRRDAVRARIEQDRAYVLGIRDGRDYDDPRVVRSDWLVGVHGPQVQQFAARAATERERVGHDRR